MISVYVQSHQQVCSLVISRIPQSTSGPEHRRYFQSQGLLSLQTWIIIFVAPINVAINYLLGGSCILSYRHCSLLKFFLNSSLGSGIDSTGVHRRSDSDEHIVLYRVDCFSAIWDLLCATQGVAPGFEPNVHKSWGCDASWDIGYR